VVIGLAPLAVLWMLSPRVAERAQRADLGGARSRLRLISEGAVAVLAITAVTLLFLRGYAVGGVDPLIAATPLLLALAACLLTLRLYPLPLRWLFSRSRRSPDISTFLGAARALREPSIGLTPVFALVVGVSVAVSSGVLLSALQHGVEQSAQSQIGADMRIVGTSFTRDQLELVRGVDGVAAATGISGAEPATLEVAGVKTPTSVFVVEADELRDVQGDAPGILPPGVSLEPGSGAMPIVVSGPTADRIGESDEVRVGGVPAEVVGVTRGPVPTGSRVHWVAFDSSYAIDVVDRDPTDRTILVRLEVDAAPAAVADDIQSALGVALRIDTPQDIVAEIETGPAAQGIRIALLTATALAALLSALAIVMTLTLAAGPRGRVLALLRTLGAGRRVSAALTMWEIGPPAIAAIVAGTVFGALVPLVVLAGVDLRPFTGSSVQPDYRVDLATLALTLGGFVALAAVLTAVALLASHRIRAASVLRTVEEG
jgi:putative ABC transport system permease protein